MIPNLERGHAVSKFCDQIRTLLEREFELTDSQSGFVLDNFNNVFLEDEKRGFRELEERLLALSLRDHWNKTFRDKRCKELAEWAKPHIRGTTIDLLCGDGRVGECLSDLGFPITLCERLDVYDVCPARHKLPFIAYDSLSKNEFKQEYDSALLCTVLHHENDPVKLLREAVKLAKRRLIIIENCIDIEFPREYQGLVDAFFNNCLNHIALPCPNNHRSVEGWLEITSDFGTVEYINRNCSIPGIPLSHHLIVIELRNHR